MLNPCSVPTFFRPTIQGLRNPATFSLTQSFLVRRATEHATFSLTQLYHRPRYSFHSMSEHLTIPVLVLLLHPTSVRIVLHAVKKQLPCAHLQFSALTFNFRKHVIICTVCIAQNQFCVGKLGWNEDWIIDIGSKFGRTTHLTVEARGTRQDLRRADPLLLPNHDIDDANRVYPPHVQILDPQQFFLQAAQHAPQIQIFTLNILHRRFISAKKGSRQRDRIRTNETEPIAILISLSCEQNLLLQRSRKTRWHRLTFVQ